MNQPQSNISHAQTAMFRIADGTVTGSASPEEAANFKEEIDYLHYFVVRIGEEAGMQAVDFGAFVESGTRVAFRFNQSHGVQTGDLNGMVTTAPIPVKQLMEDLC